MGAKSEPGGSEKGLRKEEGSREVRPTNETFPALGDINNRTQIDGPELFVLLGLLPDSLNPQVLCL